jgi:hypothetical protein
LRFPASIRYDIAMEGLSSRITHRQKLEAAKKLALLLDACFEIPGTGKKVGLDAMLGLFPVVGDLICMAVSLYIIYLAREMGVPRMKLGIMVFNVLVDTFLGALPIFGDIFDAFWKGNLYNTRIMERFLDKEEARLQKEQKAEQDKLPPGMRVIDVVPAHRQMDKS